MTRYVGIDLHKHLIVGHVIDAAGKQVDTFRYESVHHVTLDHIGRTRLTPQDEVVLEATTNCWAVVRAQGRRIKIGLFAGHLEGRPDRAHNSAVYFWRHVCLFFPAGED